MLQASAASSFMTKKKLLSVINGDDVWHVAKKLKQKNNTEREIMIQVNFRGSFMWLMSQCKHETGVEHLCAMVTCCRYSAKFAAFLALRQKQTSQLIHLRNSIFQLNRRFCVAHLIDYWKIAFNSFSSCRNFNWAKIKFANDLRATSCHCALVFMSFLRLFKASGGVGYFYDQNNRNLDKCKCSRLVKLLLF